MPGTPHVSASDEVAWLRARVAELEGLTARLREAARDRDELAAAQLAARDAQIAALAAQVEELRRRLDKDSSTSSKPPSSDSPYKRKPRDRSLRQRSGRRPGKQPGAESSTLRQSPDPDETELCGPSACGCCCLTTFRVSTAGRVCDVNVVCRGDSADSWDAGRWTASPWP